eukprot:5755961-Ditylum_brightwellii.AAC.1
MSENSLTKLLDFNPYSSDFDKQMIDVDAIIKEAWQNPHDVDLMYTFSKIVQKCPLYQTIELELGVE